MTPSRAESVTALLRASSADDPSSWDRLVPLVYGELRSLAERQMRRERGAHTLQATALVNEAFLRLVAEKDREWQNRSHFFCAAATAMRRILVNHALSRRTQKRGGEWARVPLDDMVESFESSSTDLLALDQALDALARLDPEKSRIVELRFFVGLTAEQAAEVLGVSVRTVERQWRTARSWLKTRLDVQ